MPVPPVASTSGIYGPQVTFRTQAIAPPEAEYVGRDDILRLDVWNSTTPDSLVLSIRFLGPDGVVIPETFVIPVASIGSAPQTIILPQAEGFILSATLTGSVAQRRGLVFAILGLQRGGPNPPVTLGRILMHGYLSAFQRLSFPGGLMESNQSGIGAPLFLFPANPAQGAAFTIQVPAGAMWYIHAVSCFFQASAVAGSREPILTTAGSAVQAIMPTAITAGQGFALCWGDGLNAITAGIRQTAGFPGGLLISSLDTVEIVVSGMDAADQISNPQLSVEQLVGS